MRHNFRRSGNSLASKLLRLDKLNQDTFMFWINCSSLSFFPDNANEFSFESFGMDVNEHSPAPPPPKPAAASSTALSPTASAALDVNFNANLFPSDVKSHFKFSQDISTTTPHHMLTKYHHGTKCCRPDVCQWVVVIDCDVLNSIFATNSKGLNFYMTSAFSGSTGIDDTDGRGVVCTELG